MINQCFFPSKENDPLIYFFALFFGLIHGAQLGWSVSPLVALGYALFGVTCFALAKASPAAKAT